MDNLIEFLITIALVALFTIPSWLKKKNIAPTVTPVSEPEYDDEMMDDAAPFLQNSRPDIPNSEEYFTYETIEDEPEFKSKNVRQEPRVKPQQVENKEIEEGLLSFEEDEVLKGVIYSEILKPKF